MTFQLSFLGEGGLSTQRHYSHNRTRIRGFEGRSTQVLLASINWRTLSGLSLPVSEVECMQQPAATQRVLLSRPWGGSSFHNNLKSLEDKNGMDLLPPKHS